MIARGAILAGVGVCLLVGVAGIACGQGNPAGYPPLPSTSQNQPSGFPAALPPASETPGSVGNGTQGSETLGSGLGNEAANPVGGLSQDELKRLAAEAAGGPVEAPDPNRLSRGSINFLALLIEGGTLMIPIAVMSLLVVAIALERFFALRWGRVFPRGLRRDLNRAQEESDAASPQQLYTSAERFPSAASRIMRDVLQKVGRPIPEIETVIGEGVQREADRLYGNVRWLSLAAAVTPLIGLLGTVWGMIIAFYNTTQLGAGTNKAEFLAEGIYVALVTTLGGLAVAIPAAIFAHYFEGKISQMMADVEHHLRALVSRFETYEGRARYDISSQGMTRRTLSDASNQRGKTRSDPGSSLAPKSAAGSGSGAGTGNSSGGVAGIGSGPTN